MRSTKNELHVLVGLGNLHLSHRYEEDGFKVLILAQRGPEFEAMGDVNINTVVLTIRQKKSHCRRRTQGFGFEKTIRRIEALIEQTCQKHLQSFEPNLADAKLLYQPQNARKLQF